MDDSSLPYFFPEALLPVTRKQPSERERARGFTVKDLDWLKHLLFASHADRSKQADPMQVDRFLMQTPGSNTPAILAGAFMMGPTPEEAKVFLYTPYSGLEKFENAGELMTELTGRLDTPSMRIDLLRFLSIAQRATFKPGDKITITTSLIEGDVFEDQATTIRLYQNQNAQAMLAELLKLPTLTSMLNATLDSALRKHFPGLDQSQTRMNSFIEENSVDAQGNSVAVRRWVESAPLREALLKFYQRQAWPLGRTREFFNPKRPDAPARAATDKQHWEKAVKDIAGSLTQLLSFHLETFWNTDIKPGQSRLAFFAETMSDKSRMDLLFKRQEKIITAQQSQHLATLYLSNSTLRKQHKDPLHVEKVRIWEHYPHYVELASTLMISNSDAYLYTQADGLQLLESYSDLRKVLQTMATAAGHEDELYASLALEERHRFIGFDHPQISGSPVLGAVFTEIIQGIVDKQRQNLEYALGIYRRSEGIVDIDALLDHALDIRAMLDNRLLTLDASGRWSTRPVANDKQRPSTVQAQKAKRLEQTCKTIEDSLAKEIETHPTLQGTATIALESTLKILKFDNLLPKNIDIKRSSKNPGPGKEHPSTDSLPLVDYFIDRLISGTESDADLHAIGTYRESPADSSSKLAILPAATIKTLIQTALAYFKGHDLNDIPKNALEEMKPRLAHAMSVGIRGEAELRVLNKTLRPQDQAIITTALNPDSPDRRTRQGLNGFRPDAYSLTLERTGLRTLLPLTHCLLLSERGGIDPEHSGRMILWTPALGLEVFSSVNSVRSELARRLLSSQERLTLLESLKATDRQFHQTHSLGPFRLIERNVAQDRQQSGIEHYLAERKQTLTLKLPAKQLLSRLDDLKKTPAPLNLQRTTQVAQAIFQQQSLPVWLGMASAQELQLHVELLEQYLHNVDADRDYLHGIPSLREYAQEKLTELLKLRYPEHTLEPSEVSITPRLALAGKKQALTDFALNHFDGLDDIDFTVTSAIAKALPTQLNPASVRQLVRQLDIKTHYQALVKTHLIPGNAGAADRQQRFIKQLPWQILQHAHELKLQERISDGAYSLIQQVMDMPDAIARSTVSGAKALIRPLELIATEGAAAVKALGLYLIGPEPGSKGPQVLYSPYYQNHVLKEYEDETSFLTELRTSGTLKNWLLKLLPVAQAAIYRNLLTGTDHQSSDIRLASNPITGTLLKQLFEDNTVLLLKLLGCQSLANHQAEWEMVKDLFAGVQQAIQFLAGKLAYPLAVWQSYQYFKESTEDLQQHKWGSALKAFIYGVGQLATIKMAMEAPPSTPVPTVAKDVVSTEPPLEPPAVITTLANMDLTAPQRTRLQPYEVTDVALKDLKKSTAHGVYLDAATNRQLIPLAGKVYRVEKNGHYWQVISDQYKGPFVRKTDAQHWVFDARQHLPRFGGALTRLDNRYQTWSSVRSGMNIEAVGMKNIRRLYPEKARMIREALDLALHYTSYCKHNLRLLDPAAQQVTRVHRCLKSFFAVPTIEPSLVQKLTAVVDKLLLELVDPSLTSLNSKRFVTGSHHAYPTTHTAFTIPADAERKLYLADRFFDVGFDVYRPHLIVPFDIDTHARATTIIHELTHIVCATEDIAYLESARPFPDLLAEATGKRLKDALHNVQTASLSMLTPISELFQVLDEDTGTWMDPGTAIDTEHIEDHILKLTAGKDLNDARRIFRTDSDRRIDTILGNADSVACLITQLGRQLDPVPSSRPVSPMP